MSEGIYGSYQFADVQMYGHQSKQVLLTYAWVEVLVEKLTVVYLVKRSHVSLAFLLFV